jgi:hypothetical protein
VLGKGVVNYFFSIPNLQIDGTNIVQLVRSKFEPNVHKPFSPKAKISPTNFANNPSTKRERFF